MLHKLTHFKTLLKADIGAAKSWSSLLIDYEKPIVERMWRQEGDYRLCLHKIHPCNNTPLFHPHKWPSAVYILAGSYLMGYGKSNGIGVMPPVEKVLSLKAGDYYEMLSELEWHYVQLTVDYSYSIMVTGLPFKLGEDKSHPHLLPLSDEHKNKLLSEFKNLLSLDESQRSGNIRI